MSVVILDAQRHGQRRVIDEGDRGRGPQQQGRGLEWGRKRGRRRGYSLTKQSDNLVAQILYVQETLVRGEGLRVPFNNACLCPCPALVLSWGRAKVGSAWLHPAVTKQFLGGIKSLQRLNALALSFVWSDKLAILAHKGSVVEQINVWASILPLLGQVVSSNVGQSDARHLSKSQEQEIPNCQLCEL